MRQFDNADEYLIIRGKIPIETQPTYDKAVHAVGVLSIHAATLGFKCGDNYSYIKNPNYKSNNWIYTTKSLGL